MPQQKMNRESYQREIREDYNADKIRITAPILILGSLSLSMIYAFIQLAFREPWYALKLCFLIVSFAIVFLCLSLLGIITKDRLFNHVEDGNCNWVRIYIFLFGHSPNSIHPYTKQSLIYIAAEHHHIKIVKYLIKRFAFIDFDPADNSPLLHSVIRNKPVYRESESNMFTITKEIFENLSGLPLLSRSLDAGSENKGMQQNKEALTLEIIKNLLKKLNKNLVKRALNAVQDKSENTALIIAAKHGYSDIAKYLLANGADINIRNSNENTPLHIACGEGNLDIVKFLVEHGANINIENRHGDTPLHFSCWKGNLDIVRLLVEHGADINIRNRRGDTPLHLASKKGNLDIVKFLVELGANIDIRNRRGDTPLHLASKKGNLDIVKFLVELGADVNIKDRYGDTPLDIVKKYRKGDDADKIIEYLESKMNH